MSDTSTATPKKDRKPRFTGAIDLSAPLPAAAVKKDSGVDLSGYQATLAQSWIKKQSNDPTPGFAFDFPEAAVSTVKSRFQQAARAMNPPIGVAFETGKANADGVVRLVVEARKKKAATVKTVGAAAPAAPAQTMPAAGGKGKK